MGSQTLAAGGRGQDGLSARSCDGGGGGHLQTPRIAS